MIGGWVRVLALVQKELLASARARDTRVVVLFLPPLLLIVYAFAVTQDVRSQRLGVLDEDRTRAAREVVETVRASAFVAEHLSFEAERAAFEALAERRVDLLLRIGVGFAGELERSGSAPVQLILDGRTGNRARILTFYVAAALGRDASSAKGAAGLLPRVLLNPNREPLLSAVPALFAIMVGIVGFMVSALSIARERELGTFEQLLVTPLGPVQILVGKALPAVAIALASAMAMLALSALLLDVSPRGGAPLLLLLSTVFLASIIGLGLFISALARTQQQAVIGLFVYMTPAVLLSGYATPVANMPRFLQLLAEANPFMHFIELARACFLDSPPTALLVAHTWPLVLIAAVTMTIAVYRFRSRWG